MVAPNPSIPRPPKDRAGTEGPARTEGARISSALRAPAEDSPPSGDKGAVDERRSPKVSRREGTDPRGRPRGKSRRGQVHSIQPLSPGWGQSSPRQWLPRGRWFLSQRDAPL